MELINRAKSKAAELIGVIKGRYAVRDAEVLDVIKSLLIVLPDSMAHIDKDETWEDCWSRLSPEARNKVRAARTKGMELAKTLINMHEGAE